MKSEVIVLNNQTIADITIQEKGNISAWFDIAIANDMSITQVVSIGQILNVDGEPLDIEIVNFYSNRQIKPATGINITETPSQNGINYWTVGQDFIVQK